MSCHGALEPSSAGPPSGRLSADCLAVTHTRTPMEWAPGDGGTESTMHGAKERGARTKLGPPRAGDQTLRNTSPADTPRLSGNCWVSPWTVDARTRGTLGEAVVRLPLTGCTAGGRPGWVAAASAGLTWA